MRFFPTETSKFTLLATVLALTLASCVTVQSPTEAVIDIDAALSLRPDIDELIVSVQGGTSHSNYTTEYSQRLRTIAGYPVRVVVVPEAGDASRVFAVSIVARMGTAIVGRSYLRGHYVEGQSTPFSVLLDDACRSVASRCTETQSCVGGACVELPIEGQDAGVVDAGDASVPRDAFMGCSIDSDCPSRPCENATCTAGSCVYASRCGAGEACCGDVCAANCDCMGMAAGVECREVGGPCDVAESCDGTSPACPPDALRLFGTCRAAALTGCDLEEVCTGASKDCPADRFASAGLGCGGLSRCDGAGLCNAACVSGPCTLMAGRPCAMGTYNCLTNMCDETGFAPATRVCRASTSGCDPAEMCSGSSAICPADAFEPATTVCGAAVGPCQAPSRCAGSSPMCLTGELLSRGTICGGGAGPCEIATCGGMSAECRRSFRPETIVCRAAVTALDGATCDQPETCTGASAACPADVWLPSRTICRALLNDACDNAEVCDGMSPVCPPDSRVPNRTPCVSMEACGVCQGGLCETAACSPGQRCCPARAMCMSDLERCS